MRTGYAHLPLHGGRAPRWLFQRMVKLAREIACHVVADYGPGEMLRRLSDPYWFQAFGCVLGFDWHSSGVTTTACGALKEGIKGLEADLGLHAAGGKGAVSRRTPGEIEAAGEATGLDPTPLVRASRLTAKVDSACVQDGYDLYHHAFFFTPHGQWCVVQQGLNDASGYARRYHWLGEGLASFVEEPHAAVCCDRQGEALNLVAAESGPTRRAMTDLAGGPATETLDALASLGNSAALPDLFLPRRHGLSPGDVDPRRLGRILLSTYERAPADFVQLIGLPGVGAKTLRALALAAEVIHGTPASFRDPARFSFAHGGKDGIPYPVDRPVYDHTVQTLHDALVRTRVGQTEKRDALRRLRAYADGNPGRAARQAGRGIPG